MKTFVVGSDAAVTIPFHDTEGNVVSPTALSYDVKNGEGAIVVGSTAINTLSGTETVITVPASAHVTPGGYTVTLKITANGAIYTQEEIYAVAAAQRLIPPVNSMQTYAEAMFTSGTVPNLISWLNADKDEQIAALLEAYRRLTRLNYVIPSPQFPDVQSYLDLDCVSRITPRMWPLMTADLFAGYPDAFRKALKLAQVIEANQVLTADPYADRRRAGLMSESIGESSMMFKGGARPLELAVSRATLDALAGYVSHRMTLTRS